MDAISPADDEHVSSTSSALTSLSTTPSVTLPPSEANSPRTTSPTTFDLPIRSFLEAYQHPAFVLEAQSLFESLVQRLSIWRTSDPEEPGNVESNMVSGITQESVGPARRDRGEGEGSDRGVGSGSGVGSDTHTSGSPVLEHPHKNLHADYPHPQSDSTPSDSTIKSLAALSNPAAETPAPPELLHRLSDPHQITKRDVIAGNILSEAFAPAPAPIPGDVEEVGVPINRGMEPVLATPDVVMDSLSELPTTERTTYYPYITGRAADVGWNHTLRELLTPVWANAAWYNLLHAMNVSTLLGSDDGLLELLSRRDIQLLTSFLRSVVAQAGGIPPGPDTPALKSVQLELVSHNPDFSYQNMTSLHTHTPTASSGGSSNDTTDTNADDLGHVGEKTIISIELVATMIDSTPTPSAPQGQHPLAGQYLVITSIASALPSPIFPPPSRSSTTLSDALNVRPNLVTDPSSSQQEELPPSASVASPPTALSLPMGFILESTHRSKRRRPGPLGRQRLPSRGGGASDSLHSDTTDDDDPDTSDSLRPTDSNMMEWASPSSASSSSTEVATSEWIPADVLEKDPFCRFLASVYMGRQILAFPWHTTPLGALAKWSGELKSLVSLMLASPFRESLWVGQEAVLL